MILRCLFLFSIIALCSACTNLLNTEFENLPSILNGTVDLPGQPDGDRLIVTAALIQTANVSNNDDSYLVVHRAISGVVHGNVFFDPIDAGNSRFINFSWEGEIVHDSSGVDLPVVTANLKNLTDEDTPNLFSKLIIRLGPQKLSVVVDGEEAHFGLGVTGEHGALLRIEPATKRYWFTITGEGVSLGGSATIEGTLSNTTVDPNNIGLALSFDGNIDAGQSRYVVPRLTISRRSP
jgi:hypothetical protein